MCTRCGNRCLVNRWLLLRITGLIVLVISGLLSVSWFDFCPLFSIVHMTRFYRYRSPFDICSFQHFIIMILDNFGWV